MADFAKELLSVNLEDEMKQSYLDYAMSVIVGRALPDVRDGLKPVHRRVLFAMHELGNDYNKPYKKSARVVGDVIGKYHPHGDTAAYDTIVRMAQPFSLRYMLVDGQGNFGSVDGDAPAAMRYTEVRMARIAHDLIADLEKETVDFVPNYDETELIPAILPTRVPNLLVNGSAGIAVGMATNIPPHNLAETIDACLALQHNPEISISELMQVLPGPDFPTAAIIHGTQGIYEAYHTGRGRIPVRAKAEFETVSTNKQAIIFTEIPYQVNKARLIEKIAELVKDKKLEGISELRDESDKDGMRIVVELRRGELAEVVLNNLYQQTPLQSAFGVNMVALVDGQPRLLNLKQILEAFLRHRREVVTRRTLFDLRKAKERAHLLEGLTIAIANIDAMIALIRSSANRAEAKQRILDALWQPGQVLSLLEQAGADASRPTGLSSELGFIAIPTPHYRLSDAQTQAILDLQLHRLTGLEQDKVNQEFQERLTDIAALLHILNDPNRLQEVIREELLAIKTQYGDARRTAICLNTAELSREDLIESKEVVVTLSHAGYAKYQPLSDYTAQKRGGRGKSAATVKDEDFIDQILITNTHDTILCFSSRGKVYQLKAYELPESGRLARGRPLVNLLPLEENERINAILPVHEFSENRYIFMVTRQGTVKKTPLSDFKQVRKSGIIALTLHPDDYLVNAAITDGQQTIMLIANSGKSICFAEEEVRVMGRTAAGVRGMRLKESQSIIALMISAPGKVLIATANGYGKCTPIDDYRIQQRGGMGVIAIKTSVRNGPVVGAVLVNDNDQIMLISNEGTLIRTRIAEISVASRYAQGVRLIKVSASSQLVSIAKILEEDIPDDSTGDDSMRVEPDPDDSNDSDDSTPDDSMPSAAETPEI